MPGVEARHFSAPDETRTPAKTRIELLSIAGGQIGRYTLEPGWRWSECIKPLVHTDSCQGEHVGYLISGGLHVKHDDGTEQDISSGMVYRIAPGHDAWTRGAEAAVMVETISRVDPFAHVRYYRRVLKQLNEELARLQLSVTDYEALLLVQQSPEPVRPSDLAGEIGISRSGTSRLVTRLIDGGLIGKYVSAIDHREIHLQLTPKGNSVLRQARAVRPGEK